MSISKDPSSFTVLLRLRFLLFATKRAQQALRLSLNPIAKTTSTLNMGAAVFNNLVVQHVDTL